MVRAEIAGKLDLSRGFMLLTSLLLLLSLAPSQPRAGETQKVRWYDNWDAASAQSQKQCRPLLLEIGAGWCPTCQAMEKGVLSGANFQKLSSRLVPLRADIDQKEGKSFQKRYLAPYIPTYILFRPDGKEVGRMVGQQSDGNFLVRLSSWLEKSKEVSCPSSPSKT